MAWLLGAPRAASVGWLLRLVWWIAWRIGLAVALVLAGLVRLVPLDRCRPPTTCSTAARGGSVTLLDRDGAALRLARRPVRRRWSTAEAVSPYLRNAVVATEDRRFYWHFGIDPQGIAWRVRINLREGRGPLSGNGGSTITQQMAKLLCFGRAYDPAKWEDEAGLRGRLPPHHAERKVKEAIFAMAMEWNYSKDEILSIYLNRAYLGAGTRGFEAAAQRYFGKSARPRSPRPRRRCSRGS